MSTVVQGIPIDPSSAGSPDGTAISAFNVGRASELLVSPLHGTYFQQAYRGNIYYATTTAAGVAIKISTTLTPTYSIWNPMGSNKLMVPIFLAVDWDVTSSVAGGVVWTATTNAGSVIDAAAPFVAFGTGTPVNATVGGGKNSQMRAATGGTTTLLAAATLLRTTGITCGSTAVGTASAWWVAREDYDGSMIVPPGTAVHVMASTSIAATCCITTAWAEVPL